MAAQRVSCGRDFQCCPDINATIEEALKQGFDFVSIPMVNPRFKREFIEGPAKLRRGAFTRSDMLLAGQDWTTLIVAKTSPWLQVDSENEVIRTNSTKAFQQELTFASHLGVPAILIPLNSARCTNLSRLINTDARHGHHNHQMWIKVPLRPASACIDDVFDEGFSEEHEDTWTWWNKLRLLCDSHKKLSVALELTADIPAANEIDRWFGEPVKVLIVPTSVFLTNQKGYPVLSRAHQNLVKRLYKLDVQVIVSGMNRHPSTGIRSYYQYLDHLWQYQDPPDRVMEFAKGYEDYLQCPLQPLMDNLESQTYEVFEKDPFKYSQYQKAVYLALLDRVSDEEKDTKVLVVMVLGAGRGPLVTASITAARNADRKVRVYAVEKNPNAVVTLENLREERWGDHVTVVAGDMRVWDAPELADIIVSELLGSFGDNELSPECLDGAQKFLKEDGISIPCSYTSYLAPLSSSRLWNECRLCKDTTKPPEAPFETPYVVRLQNVSVLGVAQPLFTFQHPNREEDTPDNSRYGAVNFDIAYDVVMHGLVGYFYCILYADVTLSIVPETHSPGMFSWFPIYFPIKEPLQLRSGDVVSAHFWRLCDQKNVWYEWAVTSPQTTVIHNPRGRSYTIGL